MRQNSTFGVNTLWLSDIIWHHRLWWWFVAWCHQTITQTNTDLLSIGPLKMKFSEIIIKYETRKCKLAAILLRAQCVNTLRPRQNGRHFADDMFKCIFLNENLWIPIEISLTFVPKGSIDNIPALVQIMAWRRPGDKPLSEPRMVSLPTHICVTRPQWVNKMWPSKTIWWCSSHWTLVQAMGLLPDGTKPLPEPMLISH